MADWIQEAEAAYAKGRFAAALHLFRQALSHAPDDANLQAASARCLRQLGEHAQAREILEAILQRQPDHCAAGGDPQLEAHGLQLRGVLRELGQLPESLSALRAAVAAGPACPGHAVALANLLADIGAFEEGLFALHTSERQIGTEHVGVLIRDGAVLQAGHPLAQTGRRVPTRLGMSRKHFRRISPQIDLQRSGVTLAFEECGRHG